MPFPTKGRSADDLLAELEARKANDVRWKEGRVFAYVYDAGPEAMETVKQAYSSFLTENGLDPTSFPSCLELERDVIAMALDLQNAPASAKGSFTTGGTESILLSVKTARDHARATKPHITAPELILPETAHPAFYKACKYFDVTPVVTPVDPDGFTALPDAMEKAISDQTVMLVGSAPSYAHGVVDPIAAIGQIALKHGLLFHVDCCVGGMYLPFARKLGADIPDFDLSTPGVTQMSLDFHKWGYAAKGASCVLYTDGALRKHQIFAWSGWTGYTIVNPTMQSGRSGGPIAGAWAALNFIGEDGYLRFAKVTQEGARKICEAIHEIDGLKLLGKPPGNLLAFAAEDFDIFALSDAMKAKGWYLQPQFGFGPSPANLHISVGFVNAPNVDAMLDDLRAETARLRADPQYQVAPHKPEDIATLADMDPAELLDSMSGVFAARSGGSGAEMRPINTLMDALPHTARDRILKEYVNRLYAKDRNPGTAP
ncbi:MAG: Sphingosine-1-phosphate lyase (SP-lyase) (SPL) (Sphingosine-1-phosphate aldolase) [Oceanicaulis sp. HLUCCA04]|nr:MAG: Sphingosine-1-phosphate lyase (SP-lyase) (SPL) (Sphingosine-1-phosphate aldolase) [Oceanicaulis sp. HLUCCA04]